MAIAVLRETPSSDLALIQTLVVDDNPANLKLTKVLLTAEGYSVRTAQDARSALAMLDTFVPKVILLDLGMPGMNGFELARRLEAHPLRREFVLIAVTAFAMKGDAERAFAAGCEGYVSKPIDPDALLRTIAQRLDEKAIPRLKARSLGRESRGSSS
jgi:two-component system, cell cycle response regulator DivK